MTILSVGDCMVQVIQTGRVPVYEAICPECRSRIRYMKSDLVDRHLTCPICGQKMVCNPRDSIAEIDPKDYICTDVRDVLNDIDNRISELVKNDPLPVAFVSGVESCQVVISKVRKDWLKD